MYTYYDIMQLIIAVCYDMHVHNYEYAAIWIKAYTVKIIQRGDKQ